MAETQYIEDCAILHTTSHTIMSPTHSLIDFLILQPNQECINFLDKIQSFKTRQFTIYYIPFNTKIHHLTRYNSQFLLFYTYNHFKQLDNPITIHNKFFPTLQSLQQFVSTL